jgi:hypothetical protein
MLFQQCLKSTQFLALTVFFFFFLGLLQDLDRSSLDDVTQEGVDGIEPQNSITKWSQQLEFMVTVQYAGEVELASQVFKPLGRELWVRVVGDLAGPVTNSFMQFGESVATSRRSPEKLCSLLMMYETMKKCEHHVLQVFDGQFYGGIRTRYRELLEQVMRSTAPDTQKILRRVSYPYHKSMRGYHKSMRGYRTSMRGYRTSMRGYRTSMRGYRTSMRGYRTSIRGYHPDITLYVLICCVWFCAYRLRLRLGRRFGSLRIGRMSTREGCRLTGR